MAAEAARESSDGPAFVAMVDRFRQRVWRICFRLLNDEQDAADAAQEVFLRLFLHRGRFAGRSKYATWVHGVAVRTCLSAPQPRTPAAARSVASEPQWESHQPARADAPPGLAMDLMNMLEMLDEEDRAMLILKYAEGYDYEELAAIFELSDQRLQDAAQPGPRKTAAAIHRTQPSTPPEPCRMIFSNNSPRSKSAEPPPEFDRKLHERVNRALLVQHLLGLAIGQHSLGGAHFLRGVLGAASFSLTGTIRRPAAARKKIEIRRDAPPPRRQQNY